jgi:hypothetical protein
MRLSARIVPPALAEDGAFNAVLEPDAEEKLRG